MYEHRPGRLRGRSVAAISVLAALATAAMVYRYRHAYNPEARRGLMHTRRHAKRRLASPAFDLPDEQQPYTNISSGLSQVSQDDEDAPAFDLPDEQQPYTNISSGLSQVSQDDEDAIAPAEGAVPGAEAAPVAASITLSEPAITNAQVRPSTLAWDGELMAAAFLRLGQGEAPDADLLREAAALLAEADALLTAPPTSVMDKPMVPPSGNKHDFLSLATYFWPCSMNVPKMYAAGHQKQAADAVAAWFAAAQANPAAATRLMGGRCNRATGLPWKRHDGYTNRASVDMLDAGRLLQLGFRLRVLAQAYYFSGGDERYGARAALLLRTWFLDPATAMTPHMNFTQGVPGVRDGRGLGILTLAGNVTANVIEAARVLRSLRSPSWSEDDEARLRAWLTAYLRWLQTSPLAAAEAAATNNHGTYFHVQLIHIALHLARPVGGSSTGAVAPGNIAAAEPLVADLMAVVHTAAARLRDEFMPMQIMPDGSQPQEEKRTLTLHYVDYNAAGWMNAAALLAHVGEDVWAWVPQHWQAELGTVAPRTLAQGHRAPDIEARAVAMRGAQLSSVDRAAGVATAVVVASTSAAASDDVAAWVGTTADRRPALRRILDRMAPYVTGQQAWPLPQVEPFDVAAHYWELYRRAALAYNELAYEAVAQAIPGAKQVAHPGALLWPWLAMLAT
jgi:hypothetical protein